MGERIIDVNFRRVGRRFLDRSFCENQAFSSAKRLVSRAQKVTDPDKAFVLLQEANSRLAVLCARGGRFENAKRKIREELKALISKFYPELRFSLFEHNRNYAYQAARGVYADASKHVGVEVAEIYKEIYDRFPAFCKEALVSDLFYMSVYEGIEGAREILRSLSINPDALESPLVDVSLSREVNPSLPVSRENLALMYYASGLWKEKVALCDRRSQIGYLKAAGMLLYWALEAGKVPSGLQPSIQGSFIPNANLSRFPRGYVFKALGYNGDDLWKEEFYFESIRSHVESFVRSLKQIKDAILEENRSVTSLINDDVFLYANMEFVKPAISRMEQYLGR